MLAPLSWLKQYIDITLPPKELAERLTEVGLGCEKILKEGSETILELEITPNRPDLLSILGVAREIAAIEKKKIVYPSLKTDLKPKKTSQILPLTPHPNFSITPRLSGIIINNIEVKDSPKWLSDRLVSIGQKPINNIVDITNFVMYELGNPIHSFDYHSIKGQEMWVKQAKGGEVFESVDEITYHLPKGAIIYEDTEKIFDLVGIKGGKNSGTYKHTKAVFIVVEVDDPILIRRASQALSLRSDASAIFERNVNRGGTIDALKRTADLILELTGGEIASEVYDLKKEDFKPWHLELRLDRLEKIVGITIPETHILSILESLNLSPKLVKDTIHTTIPTYRNDLKIEEDLIEEVARIYGYNNFPKTMPSGQIPTFEPPHYKNYRVDEQVKRLFLGAGFSEIVTYSLISEEDVESMGYKSENCLRVDNPVSREFEYLRPSLKSNVLKAFYQNKPFFKHIHLFELGKVYIGKSLDKIDEHYVLSGISNTLSYLEVKGLLERIGEELGIDIDTEKAIEIIEEGVFFELNYSELLAKPQEKKLYKPLPKFPPLVEDMAFIFKTDVKTGDIIKEIKKQSNIIVQVDLLDVYENTKTFHIVYQHKEKNLTTQDIAPIRENIIKALHTLYKTEVKK